MDFYSKMSESKNEIKDFVTDYITNYDYMTKVIRYKNILAIMLTGYIVGKAGFSNSQYCTVGNHTTGYIILGIFALFVVGIYFKKSFDFMYARFDSKYKKAINSIQNQENFLISEKGRLQTLDMYNNTVLLVKHLPQFNSIVDSLTLIKNDYLFLASYEENKSEIIGFTISMIQLSDYIETMHGSLKDNEFFNKYKDYSK